MHVGPEQQSREQGKVWNPLGQAMPPPSQVCPFTHLPKETHLHVCVSGQTKRLSEEAASTLAWDHLKAEGFVTEESMIPTTNRGPRPAWVSQKGGKSWHHAVLLSLTTYSRR